ncbi:MAG: ribonuclease P protein component 4 [Candidatus Nanoarchaeia archaeon]
MKKKIFLKKKKEKKIASERILYLYNLGRKCLKNEPCRAQRYAEIANKIKQKFKLKLIPEQKRLVCKECKKLIVPGINCRVRVTRKTISYYCFECKNFTRIGYKKNHKN